MLYKDHPVIANMMKTGYPDGKTPESPVCPICGERCSEIYIVEKSYEIIGCDECIISHDPDKSERCPQCKELCDTVYKSLEGTDIGCENCVKIEDAWSHTELYQKEA